MSAAFLRQFRDHPRTRGVYDIHDVDIAGAHGSSPHARGLLTQLVEIFGRERIIPARAGFTGRRFESDKRPQDHPRTRGVYPGYTPGRDVYHGSSPHARGLRTGHTDTPQQLGIIPARAGFTGFLLLRLRRLKDHPRTRGVYHRPVREFRHGRGSSPHARGLRPGRRDDPQRQGIIPARAGFTRRPGAVPDAPPDHPRTRGVYDRNPRKSTQNHGSSPHARGLLPGHPQDHQGRRIIPARAGFTLRGVGNGVTVRDHPRTRGVYIREENDKTLTDGSSPHARGLRDRHPVASP